MLGYLSLDEETTIQYTLKKVALKGRKNKGRFRHVRKEGLHGGSWKDPKNDVHTFIYGSKPDDIRLIHSENGFKRKLPSKITDILVKSHTIVGTNLKFDLGYIWHDKSFQKWLLNGGKIWDIQVAAYLLGGNRWQYPSLAEMQKVILGIKTKKDRISYLYSKNIGADEIVKARHKCPRLWKLYKQYSVEDGKTPLLIMQKQRREAESLGMIPIIELYNQYLLALTMIEINGIPVDTPEVEKLYREFSLKVVEYLEQATELVKHLWDDDRLPALNINSPSHASLLLFGGSIKVEVRRGTGVILKSGPDKGQERTKLFEEIVHVKGFGLDTNLSRENAREGYYSTDKHVIENIYKKSSSKEAKEYCRLLKLSATYKQKISTYLNALLYRSVNGIIRANYNNTETATSRLSASKPNLQNIPAHGEFGASIPALLIALKGWKCVSIDFSQLEVLCQAMLSLDPNLIRDIVNGIDFHIKRLNYIEPNYTYEELVHLCKVLKDEIWAEKRSKAKVISFQKAYGAAVQSLAKITGLSEELVQQIFDLEDIEYPLVKQFDDSVVSEVQKSAIVSRVEHYAKRHTGNKKDSKGIPRKFVDGVELLPIRSRDKKSYSFDYNHTRHVGFYKSPTGKRYSFMEFGSRKKDGGVFTYFKPTQMKNYAMQGTAGDIQAITTVALFKFLLKHANKVKLVNEIHDSKWFLIKEEYVSRIVPIISSVMKSTSKLLKKRFNIDVPFDFDVETKIGDNFADMKIYNQEENK